MIADRLPVAAGPVEAIDEDTCAVQTGADNLETLVAGHARSGHLSVLAERYRRAAG